MHDPGEIVIDGVALAHQVHNLAAVRSRVGMVFQHCHLFSHMTVRRNLTLGAR